MTRRALLVLVALLTVVYGCGGEIDQPIQGLQRTSPLTTADLTLPDALDGRPVPLRARTGGLLVLYFGYTHCPDVCPTTMSDLRTAVDELSPQQQSRIDVAMVTVDPGRDEPADISAFVQHFFSDATALRSTDPTVLQPVYDALGVFVEIEAHEPGESYEVGHTALTYVVDATGTVRVEWPFGLTPDAMADDLRLLLDRAEP